MTSGPDGKNEARRPHDEGPVRIRQIFVLNTDQIDEASLIIVTKEGDQSRAVQSPGRDRQNNVPLPGGRLANGFQNDRPYEWRAGGAPDRHRDPEGADHTCQRFGCRSYPDVADLTRCEHGALFAPFGGFFEAHESFRIRQPDAGGMDVHRLVQRISDYGSSRFHPLLLHLYVRDSSAPWSTSRPVISSS
jgi:hypothetical protein